MGRRDRRRNKRRDALDRRSSVPPASPVDIVRAVQRTLELKSEFRSGPLPPPVELEHYDRVLPGAAERIVAMAERRIAMAEAQMVHRHQLESKVIRADIRLAHLGQVFGAGLGFGGLGSAVYLMVYQGAQLGGAAVFLGAVASLMGAVILGRKRREAELSRKREEVQQQQR